MKTSWNEEDDQIKSDQQIEKEEIEEEPDSPSLDDSIKDHKIISPKEDEIDSQPSPNKIPEQKADILAESIEEEILPQEIEEIVSEPDEIVTPELTLEEKVTQIITELLKSQLEQEKLFPV